jgi:hypothetical protein
MVNGAETERAQQPKDAQHPLWLCLSAVIGSKEERMQDITTMLATLRRPRLLLRAARLGVKDYRRRAHLRQILRCAALPVSGAAVLALIEIESEMDAARRRGDAAYSPLNHVSVLIAMMGEARLLRASQVPGDA